MPELKNESQEADGWASGEGRSFTKRKVKEATVKGHEFSGSPLVAGLKMIAHEGLQRESRRG